MAMRKLSSGPTGWGSAVTKSEYMFMFARISASTSTSTGLKAGTVISTGSYELNVNRGLGSTSIWKVNAWSRWKLGEG
ncbi:MAG: hypothetical protein V8R08_08595 [Coriobacteriales bacterium]